MIFKFEQTVRITDCLFRIWKYRSLFKLVCRPENFYSLNLSIQGLCFKFWTIARKEKSHLQTPVENRLEKV